MNRFPPHKYELIKDTMLDIQAPNKRPCGAYFN